MVPENLDLGFTIKSGSMSQAGSLVLSLASGRRNGLSSGKLYLQILAPEEMSMPSPAYIRAQTLQGFQC